MYHSQNQSNELRLFSAEEEEEEERRKKGWRGTVKHQAASGIPRIRSGHDYY